jgi:hypothetical protein
MDYVTTFPTGIEPLSLSSSSNKTNELSQNKVSVSNDGPASTTKQLSVQNDFPAITTSSFLQHYVPMNATIAHISATTATTNATMTEVPATRNTTINMPKYQLDKCKQLKLKTR